MHFHGLIPELYVRDLNASLKFYTESLHFAVIFSREEQGFHFLQFEDAQVMLCQLQPGSWVNGTPTYPFGSGMNLAIKTCNLDAFDLPSLAKHIFIERKEYEYQTGLQITRVQQVTFQDPDGYLLRFVQELS